MANRERFDINARLNALNKGNKQNVVTDMLGVKERRKNIYYKDIYIGEWKKYDIDQQEVIDLANSIATIGLEQNLVVKETEDENKFVVVTGHKRLTAINYIFDNNIEVNDDVLSTIKNPACVVIEKEEPELVTQIRMHETNQHARAGFSFSEIEDYYQTIEEARKIKLKVNGREIVGKTRDILRINYGFGDTTARKYVKAFKDGSEELKQKLRDGEISINEAYSILMGYDKISSPKKDVDKIDLDIQGSSENKKTSFSDMSPTEPNEIEEDLDEVIAWAEEIESDYDEDIEVSNKNKKSEEALEYSLGAFREDFAEAYREIGRVVAKAIHNEKLAHTEVDGQPLEEILKDFLEKEFDELGSFMNKVCNEV